MTTLLDLIASKRLNLSMEVLGSPVVTKDGALLLDGAQVWRAHHRGIEPRIVCIALAPSDDSNGSMPEPADNCHATEESAQGQSLELEVSHREARERLRDIIPARFADRLTRAVWDDLVRGGGGASEDPSGDRGGCDRSCGLGRSPPS